ncbi:aldose 1-epimerase [Conyzicola nivalis]|jgi:aldose 1-epimerase|uniref:Aldose 1-epimerase n=1 Tax=Conyzicola nivalis TaxID=1477021 RepID=A0ABV2QQ75_9MICO
MRAPTGEQFVLTRTTPTGSSTAIITEVAAGLRTFEIDGVALTEPFAADRTPPFGDGIVLVPWPNRVEDGIWLLDGKRQHLDITEPARHNAIHGLLRSTAYRVTDQSETSVTLAATVYPQHGYTFMIDSTVTYELVEGGLTVTHAFRNLSGAKAPVAVGTHPFFRIGDVPVEDLVLRLSASTRFETDDRLIPLSENPVEGTEFDLRDGVRVGDLRLDDAFGGVTVTDGESVSSLTAPDGRRVEMWQDDQHPYVQVFTTRKFPKDGGLGLAVAIEPMTAAPNALNTGLGLKWLEPDERWVVRWGIRYSG